MISSRFPIKLLKLLVIALPVAAILLLIGCTPSHPQSTFDPAGPIADKQADLFILIFWVAVGVFVVVEGILLYAMIRFRRRQGDTRIPEQTHGNTPLEIGWTIAPAIVLAVIAVPTVIYIFDIDAEPPDEGSLVLNVTGHQWWWEFEYPQLNIVTANELHVPVDTDIKVFLRSDDVIHSFWIPKLAGKQDVVPANTNFLKFTAGSSYIDDELPATFWGQCAELCGVAHAHMRFQVVVDSQEGFDAWVENYRELAQRPPPERGTKEADGLFVFQTRGCLLCHTTTGAAPLAVRRSLQEAFERGEKRFPAPNLTNVGTRQKLAAGIIDLNELNLERWLRDPEAVKQGNRMSQLFDPYTGEVAALTEDEIDALAAYLLSLK